MSALVHRSTERVILCGPSSLKRVQRVSKSGLPESQAAKAKDKYRVTNWPDYDRALVLRGDVTVWFDEDFLRHHWHGKATGKRGTPLKYSDTAIQTWLLAQGGVRSALPMGGRSGAFADASDGRSIAGPGSYPNVAARETP
ncbi:MAG: transposase [Pseudomonadota bacterium]